MRTDVCSTNYSDSRTRIAAAITVSVKRQSVSELANHFTAVFIQTVDFTVKKIDELPGYDRAELINSCKDLGIDSIKLIEVSRPLANAEKLVVIPDSVVALTRYRNAAATGITAGLLQLAIHFIEGLFRHYKWPLDQRGLSVSTVALDVTSLIGAAEMIFLTSPAWLTAAALVFAAMAIVTTWSDVKHLVQQF